MSEHANDEWSVLGEGLPRRWAMNPMRGVNWEEALEDLITMGEDELRECLAQLSQEERAISYPRHVIQGRIDLIRAELDRRGSVTLSPEELARVLLCNKGCEEEPERRGTLQRCGVKG